jgi:hypothetical protein
MTEKLARALYLNGELQHEEEYRGRGMSNYDSTHAVIGTFSDFMEAIRLTVDELVNSALGCEDEESRKQLQAEYNELNLEQLASIRVDDLGLESIFY